MNRLLFWLNWPLGYKILYSLFFILLLGALSLLGYSFWLGDAATIQWYHEGDLEIVKFVLDRFNKHFFEFTVDADSYLLVEEFKASSLQINHLAHYLQFAGLMVGCVLLLTAISDLPLAWYAGGLTFIIFLIAVMGLELHHTSSEIDHKALPLIIMLIIAGTSYLFRTLLKNANYLLRFLTYSTIVFGISWFIGTNTQIDYPVLQVSADSIALPIIMLAAFCLINGHEMVRAIVFIITNANSKDSGKNLRFGLLTLFYLLNLIYAYAHLNYGLDLDIYYLHPAPLLILTTLLGIWGFPKREVHYAKLFNFAPTGAFIYLGMAFIAVSTTTFSIANGNDSLREICEDVIMYTHIGMGVGFFGYVVYNFRELIAAGHKAHRVIYKPMNFDYGWAWAFGAFMTVGFLIGNGFFIFSQGFAAYSIGKADLAWASGDKYTAKQYYNQVLGYDGKSHRANYCLASIAEEEKNKPAAYFFYKKAQEIDYRPYDYAKMADLKNREDDYLKALFDLQLGVEHFPKSGELLNNLALQFNQTSLADSAFLYFDLAKKYAKYPEVVESNMFSLWTKYDIKENLDSIYANWEPSDYIGTRSNELAYLNKIGQLNQEPLIKELLPDSVLSTTQLCYLYNYTMNRSKKADQELIDLLKMYLSVSENLQFDKYLHFAIGNILYNQGWYQESLNYLKAAQSASSRINSYFPNLIGLRLLQLDQFEKAAGYFKDAYQKGNEQALLHLAIAQSELTDKTTAIETWQKLANSGKQNEKEVAHDMLKFLVSDSLASLQLQSNEADDITRFRYLHYHQKSIDDETFDQLYKLITSNSLKVSIAAERTHFYLDQNDLANAAKYMQLLTQEEITDEVNESFQMAYLRYTHAQGALNDDFMEKVMSADYAFGKAGLKDFYQAEYLALQNNFDQAEPLYLSAMKKLPFEVDIRVRLNELYSKSNQVEKGYLMLVEELKNAPQSVVLIKTYIMTCLDLGYTSYAEDELSTLETLLDAKAFQEFNQQYQNKLKQIEETIGDWN